MFSGCDSTRHDAASPCTSCLPPVWRVDPLHPEPRVIGLAGELLSRGGVIVYPTETLYGLGGNPQMPEVADRIFRIKGRGLSKPLPLIASSLEAVHQAVAEWSVSAERLSHSFWPGPLALVLRAATHILPQIHGSSGKIAIRVSSHAVAGALAAEAGGLLIATSANLASRPACRTPDEIPEELLAQIDGLIDAGPSGGGPESLPSTIVDVSERVPKLIRAGRIPWEHILGAMC